MKVKITSAESQNTAFYRVTLQDAIDIIQRAEGNVFIIWSLTTRGWNGLDIDSMFGSYVDGDTLYICVTDGEDLYVDGESIYPEEALKRYGPDKLSEYIQDADTEVITRYITPYELNTDFDLETAVIDILNENYSFQRVVDDAEDADLLN